MQRGAFVASARVVRVSLLLLAALPLFLIACSGGAGPNIRGEGPETEETTAAQAAEDNEVGCKAGEARTCGGASSSGAAPTQTCVLDKDGVAHWSTCTDPTPSGGSSTPLVLVFDGAPVSYVSASRTFDLAGDGASHATDWPTAKTPWLALDRDGNGRIDDGGELFGSMTALPSGQRAKNGFEALAALDENHDGVLDANDPGFEKLLVWADDGDRVSSSRELRHADASIVSIELGYRTDRRCNAGNCEIERARFTYRDAIGALRTGEVVDVHLRHR